MSWIKDLISPKTRQWEEFYRNRYQHDKVVRSTHGVNCTGGCSWNIHVKDGIVVWETQALDYPLLEKSLPPYEPRGCQRGISFSWYLYSPIRVKYPMIRGALLDAFNEEKAKTGDSDKLRSACVVVGISGPRRLSPAAEQLDKASRGQLGELLKSADIDTGYVDIYQGIVTGILTFNYRRPLDDADIRQLSDRHVCAGGCGYQYSFQFFRCVS